MQIRKEKIINKPVESIWNFIEPAENLSKWYPGVERSLLLDGEGMSRRQRMFVRWRSKLAQIDQEITGYEPQKLIQWKHIRELIGGNPAPRIYKGASFTIHLEPNNDSTLVIIQSQNIPSNIFSALLLNLVAKPRLSRSIHEALENIARFA